MIRLAVSEFGSSSGTNNSYICSNSSSDLIEFVEVQIQYSIPLLSQHLINWILIHVGMAQNCYSEKQIITKKFSCKKYAIVCTCICQHMPENIEPYLAYGQR